MLIAIALFVQDNLSVLDFVDKDIGDVEAVKPPSLEQTPFKLVEEVKDLKELAAKLKSVDEFAVKSDFCDYVLLINNAVVQPYCSSFFFSAFWFLFSDGAFHIQNWTLSYVEDIV